MRRTILTRTLLTRTLFTRTLPLILAITTLFVIAVSVANAQGRAPQATSYKEKILFNFAVSANGLGPRGGVIQDAAGNFYGTTFTGGVFSSTCIITNGECGVVYKIDKNGNETILHDFMGVPDGGGPWGNLVLDAQGNLYGATSTGGDGGCQCGTVYKIDSAGNLTVLYTFLGALDGFGPMAGVVRDQAGNLYGASATGGAYQLGTIFKIDANGNFTLLHSFAAWDGMDLFYAPLTLDAAGNLYGIAAYGGSSGSGTVFKLDPTGKLTVLYSFTLGRDGGFPSGPVALDSAGNVYGSTYEGGVSPYNLYGAGVVFQVQPGGKYSVLHSFPNSGNGGSYGGGVIIDQAGNLFGTTSWDGAYGGGSAFKIDTSGNYTTLHNFGSGTDGRGVWAQLTEDSAGNLYGAAESGGSTGGGVVFELSPN